MSTPAKASDLEPLAALRGIAKRYGGVQALAGVDLDIYPGAVHAICGENGAGKSTLMKILAGAEVPDTGEISLGGTPVRFNSVHAANAAGVAIVFQELSLFPDLDVLSNLYIMREPVRGGLVDRAAMRRQAAPVLKELGLSVDVATPVGQLRIAEQQLVEIAKALLADARLLILDEPNSALNAAESQRLFSIVRQLKRQGVAILFISHRLEEVVALSDVITVMRNGEVVRTVAAADATIPKIVVDMIGDRKVEAHTHRVSRVDAGHVGKGSLGIEDLSVDGVLKDFTLRAVPGEVVGLAGLEGSGATAIFDVLFGLRSGDSGTVSLPNGTSAPRSPKVAVAESVAMVPADRRTDGLSLTQQIGENISTVTAGVLGRYGRFLDRGAMDAAADKRANSLNLVRASLGQAAGSLSGGNQQKVVLAKWLEAEPDVILLNDPTRGVDVGAKAEIYHLIDQQAADGKVVLFHSTELPEFSIVCDRVLVFYRGALVGSLSGKAATPHTLLEAINVGSIDNANGPLESGDQRGEP